jgi:hypothetical protein
MKAYKLVRKLKNGDLAPLFINKTLRLQLGRWYKAEFHPTKGFAPRKGWHCTLKPEASHLTTKGRVWVEVEVENFEYFDRPENQGGRWVLADRIKYIKEINETTRNK